MPGRNRTGLLVQEHVLLHRSDPPGFLLSGRGSPADLGLRVQGFWGLGF